MPKHVEFFDKIKFGKFVRLVGFIKRKFVTMYGHMKVKLHEILKSYTRSFSKNLNLCLGNCWSWMVSLKPRPLYPTESIAGRHWFL